ncbi:MAG: GNAT family N-acetyltransferase [Streptococcus salivarius]
MRPDHQRQGIGKKLLEGFSDFPQCLSTTLVTNVARKFSLLPIPGIVELSEQACTGMIYKY